MRKIIALALGATLAALLAFMAPAPASAQTGVGVGIGTGTATSNSGAAASARGNSSTYKNPKQAGAIGLAGLAASGACLGSTSVGFGGSGFSFGGGSTWIEGHCDARENARLLIALGYRKQGMQLLMNEIPAVAKVMQGDAVVPVAYRAGQPRYVAAAGGAASANGGVPDPNCKAWQFGAVGGRCVRY